MSIQPVFPTALHAEIAKRVNDYFSLIPAIDTVLVVNSCARGKAVPESDLDFAILVKPNTTTEEIQEMQTAWKKYEETYPAFLKYKQSNPFAHLHLDIISGNYTPTILEIGVASDYFEIEIGNQICYSAPMDHAGIYFKELQHKWLPYYNEELRLQRLSMTRNACEYDLNHIPLFIKRGLYFQAFDVLCKAFQEYLQTLFIAYKTYPIAYNKWIKEQVVEWLNKPDLYPRLSPVLSVSNIESNEINVKVEMLRELLNELPDS
jgi:predicted nucleotidyltransferase